MHGPTILINLKGKGVCDMISPWSDRPFICCSVHSWRIPWFVFNRPFPVPILTPHTKYGVVTRAGQCVYRRAVLDHSVCIRATTRSSRLADHNLGVESPVISCYMSKSNTKLESNIARSCLE
jgi:hypothetical protein